MSITLRPDEKGLRLSAPTPLDELRAQLRRHPLPVTDDLFAWPLLTIDDDALTHNIDNMARLLAEYGSAMPGGAVWHAPHIKTPMSPQIWARQKAAGAWAATVATPNQLRTAYHWGTKRLLLANELVDPREVAWLRATLQQDDELDVWLQVDSAAGVDLLRPLANQPRLHVLVEFGVPGGRPGILGRTGVRTIDDARHLARAVVDANLTLGGVTGYEGPVAADATPTDLKAIADWCDQLADVARAIGDGSGCPQRPNQPFVGRGDGSSGPVAGQKNRPHGPSDQPFIVSAGGSAFLDVVLDRLAHVSDGWQLVVRSGAYVTSDDDHYAVLDPWLRLGEQPLRPAITVWAQVLSVPEAGLALLGAGRRDVPSDLGLPVPKWFRRALPAPASPTDSGDNQNRPQCPGCALGPRTPFGPGTTVVALNDQHAFLRGPGADQLHPGDVVGLGISHPCTALDLWRVAALTHDDGDQTMVTDLYTFDF